MNQATEAIRSSLEQLRSGLSSSLGDDLQSLIVYGDFVKGTPFNPESSPVNLMIVLAKVDCETLDKASPAVRAAEQRMHLTTMIVSEEDIRSSCDVFPVKFHDIQMNYRVLLGKDIFDGLEISDDHLRLRCEQELKNLMIRMNWVYLHQNAEQASLAQALIETAAALVRVLPACLTVKSGITPEDEADIIESFKEDFGIDVQVVAEIHTGKVQASSLEEVKAQFGRLMKVVHAAANALDKLES